MEVEEVKEYLEKLFIAIAVFTGMLLGYCGGGSVSLLITGLIAVAAVVLAGILIAEIIQNLSIDFALYLVLAFLTAFLVGVGIYIL